MGFLKDFSAALLPHGMLGAALSAKSYFRGRVMLPAYLELIKDHFPDFSFHSARLIDSSFANVVVVLDDAWVFRFPRNKWRRAAFSRELWVLAHLRGQTALKLPDYSHVASQDRFGGYRMLKGTELSPSLFQTQDPSIQKSAVARFADFLGTLHGLTPQLAKGGVGLPRTEANSQYGVRYHQEQRKYLIHKLDRTLIEQLDVFFERYAQSERHPERVIHGDLTDNHLLFDPENGTLSIIDFGNVALGDPAQDFALLSTFPGWVLPYALDRYRFQAKDPDLPRRALFHSVRFAFDGLWVCLRHEGHPRQFSDTLNTLNRQLALLNA